MKPFRFARFLLGSALVTLLITLYVLRVHAQSPSPLVQVSVGANVHDVSWSPDGQVIAVAGDQGISIYNTNLQPVTTLQGHIGRVFSVSWRSDGLQLASAGEDGTVRIWDRNLTTGQFALTNTLQGQTPWQVEVQWSPNAAMLASIGAVKKVDNGVVGTIFMRDTTTWQLSRTLSDRYVYEEIQDSPDLRIPKSLAWKSDNTTLLVAGWIFGGGPNDDVNAFGSADPQVAFWNTQTGSKIGAILTLEEELAIALNAAGKLAASSIGSIEIYDITTSNLQSQFLADITPYYSVQWSPDGTKIAAAGTDSEIIVIDSATGAVLQQFIGGHPLGTVQWSPDGTRIIGG